MKTEKQIKDAIKVYEKSHRDYLKMAEMSQDSEDREFNEDQAFELECRIEELKWVLD